MIQLQDFALKFVELYEVHLGPLLELVKVSLDDISSVRHVDHPTKLRSLTVFVFLCCSVMPLIK